MDTRKKAPCKFYITSLFAIFYKYNHTGLLRSLYGTRQRSVSTLNTVECIQSTLRFLKQSHLLTSKTLFSASLLALLAVSKREPRETTAYRLARLPANAFNNMPHLLKKLMVDLAVLTFVVVRTHIHCDVSNLKGCALRPLRVYNHFDTTRRADVSAGSATNTDI